MPNYPTSLDTLTNPTSADGLASPPHATQHTDVNDIAEALEAKVGVGASTPTTAGHVLTVTGAGVTAWQAGPVLSRITILTDAQIKALPTTSVTLVPAPAAGTAIMPLLVLMTLNTTGTQYTNINAAATISVGVGETMNWLDEANGTGISGSVSGLLGSAVPAFAAILPTQRHTTTTLMSAYTDELADIRVAVNIAATNGASGNFTGGHADNVMKATVYYTVVTI